MIFLGKNFGHKMKQRSIETVANSFKEIYSALKSVTRISIDHSLLSDFTGLAIAAFSV